MHKQSADDALHNFATIWEHVECGICIIDAATKDILAINPVAARMFGDDVSKILGKKCHKVICPAEIGACPIMDKGQTVDRSERKFVKADGTTIPIIKSVAKIQYNGRLALLESFTDISNLKEAEEKLVHAQVAEEANRAKSDFLSRMSHEMRTPMNAIIGMTLIANQTDDVEKLRYCLKNIGLSASHLLGLINDVLDMAKIEAGKLELESSPFNVETLCKNICALVIRQAEEKNISLRFSLGESIPGARFAGDEMRLSQVLTNLISNAVKFTPEGGSITLSVSETRRDENSSTVRFAVSDTGIGMNADQLGKLFNAFEQTDTSISRRFGGTGLGLTIAKSIVEKMHGSISVESSLGNGSVFTVDVTLAHTNIPSVEANETLPPWNILVLDDDENARNSFAFLVKKGVARIDTAEDLPTALALLESGKTYDAFFVSWGPHAPFTEALTKRYGKEMMHEKLVLAASFLQWSSADANMAELGIEKFVSKPLFPSDITAMLQAMAQGTGGVCPKGENSTEYPDFSNISVLLAEDVPINREIFSALLEPTGLQIDTAEDGSEALAKFKATPSRYDCILMDVQMPGMDGYEATRSIRALDTDRAKTVPIIAMTANVFTEDIKKCLECGMNGHLAKPIDEVAVIEKIKEHCKIS